MLKHVNEPIDLVRILGDHREAIKHLITPMPGTRALWCSDQDMEALTEALKSVPHHSNLKSLIVQGPKWKNKPQITLPPCVKHVSFIGAGLTVFDITGLCDSLKDNSNIVSLHIACISIVSREKTSSLKEFAKITNLSSLVLENYKVQQSDWK